MEPLQAPHESPGKGEGRTEPGSLSRFRRLTTRLFGVDQDAFREARSKDEAERQEKRREKSRHITKSDAGGEPGA